LTLKLTLHVGLPKTATTTIQHVMETAKPRLAERGVLYPLTTKLQSELVQRAQLRRLLGVSGAGSLMEAMGWVGDEVRVFSPDRIIFSSERMSLVGPGALVRMHNAMAACLPEVHEVRVLAYVRDPVSWATSLCQQRLKMGTTRLADFIADPWPRSLETILSKFVDRYGLAAVTVRHMHRDHLVNGKVVDDFLMATDLAGFPVPGPETVLNQALTLHGAQVADVMASLLPRGWRQGARKRAFRRVLQAIEGPRFVLPIATQERIIEASRSDVDYIRKTWGLDLRSRLVEPPNEPELEEEAVLKLALSLVEEVQQAVAEDEGPDEDEDDGT
jgi:hypothetical protein